jgi:hypothetical protein
VKILKWVVLGVVVVSASLRGWWFFRSPTRAPGAITLTPRRPHDRGGATGSPSTAPGPSPGDTRNFVGYRVTEKLVANISESTATGRTDDVNATMTIDGTTVSDGRSPPT